MIVNMESRSSSPSPGQSGQDADQVWSLTQFFTVGFSQSRRIGVKSVGFLQMHILLFASVVFDGVLGLLRLV